MRAEPFACGAVEFTELQIYLAQRAANLPRKAPGVRP